ncbi:DUF4397 domain-containing protein [Nocardioides currus]|nr:DUF4397 domain-containing protein [Nocardioides currus]
MASTRWIYLAATMAVGATLAGAPSAQAAGSEAGTAQLMVVQALPGLTLDVDIDREGVEDGADSGAVLGPFTVPAGEHRVSFRDADGEVVLDTAVELAAGSRQDLVVHLPAQADGDPVTTLYDTPTERIGADKARVLIAHTASVAPADVRVDGTVVFRNIANGEFATADVAAGDHVAELLPSGLTRDPILGPLNVTLPAGTATMVYAVGDPTKDSMEVIAHSIALTADGTEAPSTIDTGSAGLAAGITVAPFSAPRTTVADGGTASSPLVSGGAALAAVLAIALLALRRSRNAAEAP